LVLRGEPVPYNLELEAKIDRLTPDLGSFTKKKMFGGVGYLSNGNMVFGIHKQYLLLRTEKQLTDLLNIAINYAKTLL
jgi:TfoX/Sxy family transcriptional regulator of competence genes